MRGLNISRLCFWRSAVCALCLSLTGSVVAEDIDWDREAKFIKYLSPDAFPNAPVWFRAELKKMGCRIPQADFGGQRADHVWEKPKRRPPNNLIKGTFKNSRTIGWAAICSVKGVSRLIVFLGPGRQGRHVFPSFSDRSMLQGEGNGRASFSRVIDPIKSGDIIHYFTREGVTAPRITHDGIDDGFEGKGSSILYFDGRNWQDYPGSD